MSQTYCFEFLGTKENFLEILNQYPNSNHKFFYFNDYIVEISDENYYFGIGRGGHSGGYWFKPTITETEDKLVFNGKIEYEDSYSNDKGYTKVIHKIEEGCLVIIIFPIFLLLKIYALIRLLIRKIRKQPTIKEETIEDRLLHLMDFLNCTRK